MALATFTFHDSCVRGLADALGNEDLSAFSTAAAFAEAPAGTALASRFGASRCNQSVLPRVS